MVWSFQVQDFGVYCTSTPKKIVAENHEKWPRRQCFLHTFGLQVVRSIGFRCEEFRVWGLRAYRSGLESLGLTLKV